MAPNRVLPVLHVLDSHHVGGAEFAWLDLVEVLDRARVASSFVCPPYAEFDALAQRAQRAGLACRGRLQIERTLDLRGRRAFAAVLRPFRGVVHFNLNKPDSCRHQIAIARRIGGRPLVATVHGFAKLSEGPSFRRARGGRALRSLDRVVAVSTALRDHVRALAPDASVSVIPNFIPDERIARAQELLARRAALRSGLALEPDDLAAVAVATALGAKGQDALVEQLPRALARLPRLVLVLVGRDRDGAGERLRERARALRCEPALRFAGWRDEVLEVLAAGDVLVHAPASEGLGRVIQEAMALALPVVSYAVGGVVDLVVPGRTGRLAPAGAPGQLMDALVELLSDRAAAAGAGAAGRDRLRSGFSARAALAAWLDLYDGLASRVAASP